MCSGVETVVFATHPPLSTHHELVINIADDENKKKEMKEQAEKLYLPAYVCSKVHIFREGHKNLTKSPSLVDLNFI